MEIQVLVWIKMYRERSAEFKVYNEWDDILCLHIATNIIKKSVQVISCRAD